MAAATLLINGDRIPNTRLTYITDVVRDKPKRRKASFKCDCGNVIERDLNHVRFLNIISCGCFKTEELVKRNTKHSNAIRESKSGAYRSWQAMHQRSGIKKNYENVFVCQRWSGENGFINFLSDMGDRPKNYSIERKDNNRGYEPNNCVWATALVQANNSSNTVKVTIEGETHSINEWCRIKGIGYYLIKQRRRRGMSYIEAITTPLDFTKTSKAKGGDHGRK